MSSFTSFTSQSNLTVIKTSYYNTSQALSWILRLEHLFYLPTAPPRQKNPIILSSSVAVGFNTVRQIAFCYHQALED